MRTLISQIANAGFDIYPHELIEDRSRPFKTMLQVDIVTGEKLIDR